MAIAREDYSVGKVGFVERHQLYTDEQKEAAERVAATIEQQGLRQVGISWADQHGLARGKTLTAGDFVRALRNGQDFQSATLIMDTSNNIFVPLFVPGSGFGVRELTGYPDTNLVPDPRTFRALPWVEKTGWCLSDMHFTNGKPVPFCSRQLLRRRLEELERPGYDYVAGLEVECYITRMWGPGQTEITFDPQEGLDAADSMILFRNAVKQVCRRNGLHATFMRRPALKDFLSRLAPAPVARRPENRRERRRRAGGFPLAGVGPRPHYAGGLLRHARAASLFADPDHHRRQALRAELLRAGPGRLGA